MRLLLLIFFFFITKISYSEPCSTQDVICVDDIPGGTPHFPTLQSAVASITGGSTTHTILINKDVDLSDGSCFTTENSLSGTEANPIKIMTHPNVSANGIVVADGASACESLLILDKPHWKIIGDGKITFEVSANAVAENVIKIAEDSGGKVSVQNVKFHFQNNNNQAMNAIAIQCSNETICGGDNFRNVKISSIFFVGSSTGFNGFFIDLSGTALSNSSDTKIEISHVHIDNDNCNNGILISGNRNDTSCKNCKFFNNNFTGCQIGIHSLRGLEEVSIYNNIITNNCISLLSISPSFSSDVIFFKNIRFDSNEVHSCNYGFLQKLSNNMNTVVFENIEISHNIFKNNLMYNIYHKSNKFNTSISPEMKIHSNYFANSNDNMDGIYITNGNNIIIENNVFEKEGTVPKGSFLKVVVNDDEVSMIVQNNLFVCSGAQSERVISGSVEGSSLNVFKTSSSFVNNFFIGGCARNGMDFSLIHLETLTVKLCTSCLFEWNYITNPYVLSNDELFSVSNNHIQSISMKQNGEKPFPYYEINNEYSGKNYIFSPKADYFNVVRDTSIKKGYLSVGPYEYLCSKKGSEFAGLNCESCRNLWNGTSCDICPLSVNKTNNCLGCLHRWSGEKCDICPLNYDIEKTNCANCKDGFIIYDNGECLLPFWFAYNDAIIVAIIVVVLVVLVLLLLVALYLYNQIRKCIQGKKKDHHDHHDHDHDHDHHNHAHKDEKGKHKHGDHELKEKCVIGIYEKFKVIIIFYKNFFFARDVKEVVLNKAKLKVEYVHVTKCTRVKNDGKEKIEVVVDVDDEYEDVFSFMFEDDKADVFLKYLKEGLETVEEVSSSEEEGEHDKHDHKHDKDDHKHDKHKHDHKHEKHDHKDEKHDHKDEKHDHKHEKHDDKDEKKEKHVHVHDENCNH